jgi:hypothetical protein
LQTNPYVSPFPDDQQDLRHAQAAFIAGAEF